MRFYGDNFLNAILLVSSSPFPLGDSAATRPYEFHAAPMQGYTNAPLRYLFRLLSSNAILWTEMEKVKDLDQASPEALRKRFGDPDDGESHRLTLQLGGSNVQTMEECVHRLGKSGYHFREINLNCGCPSIEAGGADFGASLMKQPELTRQLMESISRACSDYETTVSLKCRTAAFETMQDMEHAMSGGQAWWKGEHFQSLCSYIESAHEGGMSHVILHARPAILAGLSPTKNRLVPPLDYDFVAQVAAEFPHLRVTLNGGIRSMEEILSLQQSASKSGSMIQSHMAGRWLLQHPLSLATIEDKCLSHEKTTIASRASSLESILSAVESYMYFVEDSVSQRTHSMSELCLPLYLIIEELRGNFDHFDFGESLATRSEMGQHWLNFEDELYDALKDAIEQLNSRRSKPKKSEPLPDLANWKRLSTTLKSVVGTKVYNKWKRNRNELLQ